MYKGGQFLKIVKKTPFLVWSASKYVFLFSLILPTTLFANICSTNPEDYQFIQTKQDEGKIVYRLCQYANSERVKPESIYRKPISKQCEESLEISLKEIEAISKEEELKSIAENLGRIGLGGVVGGLSGNALQLVLGALGVVSSYIGSIKISNPDWPEQPSALAKFADGRSVTLHGEEFSPSYTANNGRFGVIPNVNGTTTYMGNGKVLTIDPSGKLLDGLTIDHGTAKALTAEQLASFQRQAEFSNIKNDIDNARKDIEKVRSAAINGKVTSSIVSRGSVVLKGITFSSISVVAGYGMNKIGEHADRATANVRLFSTLQKSVHKDRLKTSNSCLYQDQDAQLFVQNLDAVVKKHRAATNVIVNKAKTDDQEKKGSNR